MAVQLLPFQKMVDIPEVARRRRREICGLAITSIVLVSLILLLSFISLIPLGNGYFNAASILLSGFSIPPAIIIIFILVLVSATISLRNVDRWAPTDTCCNLMRSHPACCTSRCGGNKHCCARLSSMYIATSVLTSLVFVLLCAALFVGCNQPARSWGYYGDRRLKIHDYNNNYYDYYTQKPKFAGICKSRREFDEVRAAITLQNTTADGCKMFREEECGRHDDCFWHKSIRDVPEHTTFPHPDRFERAKHRYTEAPRRVGYYYYTTSPYPEYKTRAHDYDYGYTRSYHSYSPYSCYLPESANYMFRYTCAILLPFKIPSLILLFCLVIITARLAWSVRQIEKNQPDIAVLPGGKMVTLSAHSTVVGMASVVGDEEPEDKVYPAAIVNAGQTV